MYIQARVQRRSAEQMRVLRAAISTLLCRRWWNSWVGVPVLDAPVPQMVEHMVDALKIIDRGLPEQVIEVPKITLQDRVPLSFVAAGGTVGGSAGPLRS